tara:strand:+ start:1810 stop:2709 length:900 start_codon:yes stop_codon:yes gene_type:complete
MKKTIDFITVDYGLVENTKILIKSIIKTLDPKKYDFNINLVYQYENNKEQRKKQLEEIFSENPYVTLVEGVDQSNKRLSTKTMCGNILAWPSSYGIQGYRIGTEACTKEYICYVDTDTFFVSKMWIDEFTKKSDENFFVASRYDKDNHFGHIDNEWFRKNNVDSKLGMCWPHLLMIKRDNLIKNNLLPELTFRDSLGNFTLFCYQNNHPYYVFPMIAGSKYRHTCKNHINPPNLETNIPDDLYKFLKDDVGGDFCLAETLKDKYTLLHFHQSQGWRKNKTQKEYTEKCNNFFDKKELNN